MKRWILALVIPIAVLVCTGIACTVLLEAEREDIARQRTAKAREASASVRDRLDTTISRLSTTGGLFVASTEVTELEFREFTRALIRDRSIDNVAYIDRVPAAERAAFERRTGVPIVDAFDEVVKRAPQRREYFPYDLTATEPDEPRVNTPDAAGEPLRAVALRRARDLGTAQTTAPITTFRDELPALLVYVPVYDRALPPRSVAKRRSTLSGYTAGVLPLSRLLPGSLAGSVALTDQGRRIAGARDLQDPTAMPLVLAGRRFELQVGTGISANHSEAITLALAGLFLAATIFTVIAILLRRDAYAQGLVRERLAEQRKAEAAFEESERRHRLLSENASDWITLIDSYGGCTYSSPSVRKLLGREPEDIVGKAFTQLQHPDDIDGAFEVLKAIGRGEDPSSVELRQRHADGHWVPIEEPSLSSAITTRAR